MNQQMVWKNLILYGFCLSSCFQQPLRKYYYVEKNLTWVDAQQYCRERYNDLATFESIEDINRLEPSFSYSLAWIGLWDDPNSWKYAMGNETNSWRWSVTGETSKTSYSSFGHGDPDFQGAAEMCGVWFNGIWVDTNCGSSKQFFCYTAIDQNVKQYVYITNTRSWSSAQTYCRTHYTDLALIESKEENSAVERAAGGSGWIGLYRVPWAWSDKSQTSFRNKGNILNNNAGNEHCIAEDPKHQWTDDDCNIKRAFICQQVVRMTTTVRMIVRTDADLTDPRINVQVLQQLDALLTSQRWTNFKTQWKIISKQKVQK